MTAIFHTARSRLEAIRGVIPQLVFSLVLVGAAALFAFEAASDKNRDTFDMRARAYQTLADSMLKGRFYLIEAPQEILALSDPYDPQARAHVPNEWDYWDLSFYDGKLYLYFGVTPVAVFFLPYRFLTGSHLPNAVVVLACCFVALCFAAVLVYRIAKVFDGGAPRLALFVPPLLLLVLGSTCGLLLKRAFMYEVAIASGLLFSMMCLTALSLSWSREKPHWLLEIAAGVAGGLAIGARPNLLPALGIVFFVYLISRERGIRDWVFSCLRLGVPIALLGAALASYNFLRFGSFTEFGLGYQLGLLNSPQAVFLSPRYFWWNLQGALLSLPTLKHEFPWMDVQLPVLNAELGPFHVADRRLSLFAGLPVNILAFSSLILFLRGRVGDLPGEARGVSVLFGVFVTVTLFTQLFFHAALPRYTADYAMPLIVLTSIGWMKLWILTEKRSGLNRAIRCGALMLLVMSLYFGLILTHALWA